MPKATCSKWKTNGISVGKNAELQTKTSFSVNLDGFPHNQVLNRQIGQSTKALEVGFVLK